MRRRPSQRRLTRITRAGIAWFAGLLLLAISCGGSQTPTGAIHILTADGVVNPVMSRYIDRSIDHAEETGAAAVVIQLDTPGGLMNSMNDIIERILNSQVPVIVYVSPAGAQAASAGTFITMASHVAAMSDATRIGAATPIASTGEDIEGALGDKVTNDAVAQITGLAQKRGRNAEWAERAVREAAAVNEREALDLNVIDLIAPSLASLLTTIDGRQVELTTGTATLRTRDAPTVVRDMNFVENFLDLISDPNIAFILLNIGIIAILIELYSPGLIFPGVAGVVAIGVALFSFGSLPVNWLGVAFIALAFVLLALEPFITSHGLLSIGGIGFLVAGSLLLTGGNPPGFRVSPWLIWGFAGTMSAFIAFFMGILFQGRQRRPPQTEAQALIGRTGIAHTSLEPYGTVYVAGEEWSATAEDGPVQRGDPIVVTAVDGLMLKVSKPKEEVM
jgi:membrane-bound serine protease (ClpP class)